MSFFGSIGHALRSAYNAVTGNDDDDKKRRQQQQAQQNAQRSSNRSGGGAWNSSLSGNATQGSNDNGSTQQAAQAQAPAVNLYQAPQKLQAKPGQPPAPAAPRIDPAAQQAAQQAAKDKAQNNDDWHASPLQKIKTAASVAGGAAAGAALGIGRFASGTVQGVLDATPMALHAYDSVANAVTGNKGASSRITKDADKLQSVVDKPIDSLNRRIDDTARGGINDTANEVYKPVQVGANIATLIPGATAVLAKAPTLAAKIPGVLNAAEKVPALGSALSKVSKGLTGANDAVQGIIRTPLAKGPSGMPTEVAPGIHSVNPTQEVDAATAQADKAKQAAMDQAREQAAHQIEVENAQNAARHNSQMAVERVDRGTPVPLTPSDATSVTPDYELQSARNQALVDQQAGRPEIPEPSSTPAYMAKAGPAEGNAERAVSEMDVPAYQRKGRQLGQPFNTQTFNDDLHANAGKIAADPAAADTISDSFRATGSNNPLSLVAHGLAKTSNKEHIRDVVQKLVPNAEGNTLNRAVNAITGSDDPTDVLQTLQEAGERSHPRPSAGDEPFGPLSDAPANEPAKPVAAPEAPKAPVPQAQAPDVASQVPDFAPPKPQEPIASEARPEPPASTQARPDAEGMIQSETMPEGGGGAKPQPVAAATEPSASQPLATDAPVAPAEATPSDIPSINDAPAGEQVATAPRTHDALVKQMGEAPDRKKGLFKQRQKVDLDELKGRAEGAVAQYDDEELVNSFAGKDPATMITDANSFAVARASLERLSRMDNDLAAQQVTNIMNAMEQFSSRSGQGLRVMQEAFDDMPTPMKVKYIIKKIDAANAQEKNYAPLAEDPAKQKKVMNMLEGHLETSQQASEAIAKTKGQLDAINEAAANGEKMDGAKGLKKVLTAQQTALEASNGELVKYFNSLVPGRTKYQRAFVDFPKRMMLSSATGRLNDLATTGANLADLGATNLTQGILAKGYNAFKGAGTVTDTLKGTSKIFTGGASELRKVGGEIAGKQYVSDTAKALEGSVNSRSGLLQPTGKVGRTIQAATEAATKASAGAREQRLYQLADQEAAKKGLTGAMRKQYAESKVPTRQMQEAADQVHKTLNNLNENPISRKLNDVARAIEGKSAIGGVLKNQIAPFTSWLGGNIWNTLMDKNVVANGIKFINAARKGNPEEAINQLAKGINGTIGGLATGYALSKGGFITDTNAEGYNDAGAYFHIGNRYIPIGMAGFIAPNILLGHATYNGMEKNNGQNPAEVIAKNIGSYAWNTMFGQALGTENNLNRAVSEGKRKGGSGWDGLATGAAGVVGQAIPAMTGDVNAVLNQVGKLNPTHEAADTKVADPNSKSGKAKDVSASALKSLENRIPGLSQGLPRKQGVAAADLFDRTTRGDRDTNGSIQARKDEKTKADQAADFKARDIPNFNDKGFDDKVEARVERGEYDKAIEATKAKIDSVKDNKDIPDKDKQKLQDTVKQYQVLKNGNYDPKIRDLYKSTSVSEWRNMGDPDKDEYDPDTYQKLFDYDSDLAKSGISESTKDKSDNKFTAKEAKSKGKGSGGGKGHGGGGSGGSGRNAENDALKLVQGNTLSDAPSLKAVSFGNLTPQKLQTSPIPVLQKTASDALIKKRSVSVGKAR